jgi:hypothetical protein
VIQKLALAFEEDWGCLYLAEEVACLPRCCLMTGSLSAGQGSGLVGLWKSHGIEALRFPGGETGLAR